MTALKSEQADLVVGAVERFAQIIPLNIQEIFLWYFEQKGVDNPERFLGVGVNKETVPSPQPSPDGRGSEASQTMPDKNPENPITQNPNIDINIMTLLLGLLQQVKKEKGNNAIPEEFIKVLENAIAQEQENNNEVQEL